MFQVSRQWFITYEATYSEGNDRKYIDGMKNIYHKWISNRMNPGC